MSTGDRSPQGIEPLEGESILPSVHQPAGRGASFKLISAAVVLLASILAGGYAMLHDSSGAQKKAEKAEARKAPKVAAETSNSPKKFDPNNVPEGAPTAPQPVVASTQVPAIEPDTSDTDPIGVRSTRAQDGKVSAASAKGSPFDSSAVLTLASNTDADEPKKLSPEDERVTAARERMADLQDTMKGLVANLNNTTRPQASATQAKEPPAPLGGQLTASGNARIHAGTLVNRSLTLPKGTTFNCALKTRIVSELSGYASCQVLRNVYSDDGRVLLVERGSHMDGEYTAKYRTGQTRIFVIWSRLRTPNGVTVDIVSPATGPLGEAGIDGYVDNHWTQRFGGAMLVTIIDDAVKIAVANQQSGASTVVAQDMGDTASKVAEKMLDASVNIPPTIYKNQGETVGIYVSKDVDFSDVYELKVAER